MGMSCRYPGAADYRELWAGLVAGHDAITEVPAERWSLADHFQPWPPAPGRTYSRWGGYLADIDRFDPLFFGIVPAEADYMDPQQRLFLEESWKALEDAGLDPAGLGRARCGVFAGAPPSDYANLLRERGQAGSPHVFTGNSPAILPARVAYHLDLTGPTFGVDTACSSSLVALHQACRALAAGDCDLALAGGVAVFATPEHHLLTSSVGMLSPTGRCRTFDDSADGIVMSEGVGVVVLKPLDRALADGDPVHGVIKGTAVNQDGRTNGITAPSARSQTELALEVYRRHAIDPTTIGYVEAHGTGTRLGDPIEVEALTEAFRAYGAPAGRVPIGSIKTNIGHTSHAAGVAGLIKVLLAMRHRTVPPSLHFTTPNQLIDFPRTPFHVPTEPTEWRSLGPRRAAVSSFGFSGTNAHVVVEEYPDMRPATSSGAPRALVTLSAATEDSLLRGARELRRHIAATPGLTPHDVAVTTQRTRAALGHRLALVGGSLAELCALLDLAVAGAEGPGLWRGTVEPGGRPTPAAPLTPDADLDTVAAAWAAGGRFDFAGLHADGPVRRVHLPGYAFARERCWMPEPDASPSDAAAAPPAAHPALPRGAADTDAGPDGVRAAVLATAAAELGVAAEDLDDQLPSDDLGFDDAARVRLTTALGRRLGVDLPPTALSFRTSLAELTGGIVAGEWPATTDPITETRAPQSAAPAAPTAAAPAEPEPDLVRRGERFLADVLATEARLPADRVNPRAPLQDYGIESVLVVRLTQRLEETFGPLPSTLFFEYQSLTALAGYLATEHPATLAEATGATPAASATHGAVDAPAVVAPRAPAPVPAPRAVEPAPRPPAGGDIAVIGMSGRYPMAADDDAFWANLLAGRDCVTEVPPERWDHGVYLDDDPETPGRTYARWGGFIDDVDAFDARFFQIAPKDADQMDPQQRLFLQTSWAALEDAGYSPSRVRASARRRGTKDAAVFVGVTYGEYQAFVGIPIAGYWAVANRVSYHLGFNGPSMAVDTACSSSLTALHLACESLRRGECGYAIAGGVNVTIHPGKYLLLGAGRWASTDGRCRTFGAGGDGYVPGEGVVALVLKPLADARADGDRVLGVIRGTAVNQDGRTNGFTVPNPNAQAELIHEALVDAGVDAREVGYVEAHGTGTALGDPIEIAALTKAYRRFTDDLGYCAIGSVKSAIGHLEAAAGVAGVAKTLLQLRHETIAPTLHSEPPNPGIDFVNSPFTVARESRPWPPGTAAAPRLAAVSSFGAGGSNAHVVIAEHLDDRAESAPHAPGAAPLLLPLSARAADRLTEQARRLRDFLASEAGLATPLHDVSWTLRVGREPFEHRLALVAATHEEAVEALDAHLAGRTVAAIALGEVPAHQERGGTLDADRAYLRALAEQGHAARLGELWTQGWRVDFEELAGDARGRVVSLPTYPFARDRHWIDPADFGQGGPRPAPAPVPRPVAAHTAAPEPVAASATAPDAEVDLRTELTARVREIFADLTRKPVEELDGDADFLHFGFDSVVVVRMLNRLMKAYGVRIPASSIEDNTTIDSFVRYVLDGGYITRGQGDERDADRDEVARVLAAPALQPPVLTREEPFPVESVFITGVTGVLGGRLLYDLLSDTGARVTCLVRGDDQARAAARVRGFLDVYDEEGLLTEAFERRVEIVLGDVGKERMGLTEETWERLAGDVDVTIHAAARTTLVTFYDALAPVNVDGTRRAIDFALRTRHKYLVYVSSFSAMGDWQLGDNRPFTERDLELGQGYDHLPYQETKYHSEKLIRAATEQGLVWNIFRPGNIMGDSRTGRYPFQDVTVRGVYYDMFKTAVETGWWMRAATHWDISPVDYVSAGLLHLALRRPSYRETYHLTNPDVHDLIDVYAEVDAYGYEIRPMSVAEYHRHGTEGLFRARGSDEPYESQMLEMIKYGVEIWGPQHYDRGTYADCAYTSGVLREAGIVCPPNRELVPRYLEHCVKIGYLPAPTRPERRGTEGGAR
ncbi:beta-ketoacyl synthase N-terminal-like domain-containing protein [Streptomyces sp. 8K308]|uniref:beta-ketoacyl synthase N-terminal-like domain-containing protein n=1 Tax=Streptomyces sp. 8K308 TaxID=2530388 RepID=UPI0024430C33|nr:beta-ketoacyl synthase N-terminal-like domain-containing protein [Streptomyces sp. 8K308]